MLLVLLLSILFGTSHAAHDIQPWFKNFSVELPAMKLTALSVEFTLEGIRCGNFEVSEVESNFMPLKHHDEPIIPVKEDKVGVFLEVDGLGMSCQAKWSYRSNAMPSIVSGEGTVQVKSRDAVLKTGIVAEHTEIGAFGFKSDMTQCDLDLNVDNIDVVVQGGLTGSLLNAFRYSIVSLLSPVSTNMICLQLTENLINGAKIWGDTAASYLDTPKEGPSPDLLPAIRDGSDSLEAKSVDAVVWRDSRWIKAVGRIATASMKANQFHVGALPISDGVNGIVRLFTNNTGVFKLPSPHSVPLPSVPTLYDVESKEALSMLDASLELESLKLSGLDTFDLDTVRAPTALSEAEDKEGYKLAMGFDLKSVSAEAVLTLKLPHFDNRPFISPKTGGVINEKNDLELKMKVHLDLGQLSVAAHLFTAVDPSPIHDLLPLVLGNSGRETSQPTHGGKPSDITLKDLMPMLNRETRKTMLECGAQALRGLSLTGLNVTATPPQLDMLSVDFLDDALAAQMGQAGHAFTQFLEATLGRSLPYFVRGIVAGPMRDQINENLRTALVDARADVNENSCNLLEQQLSNNPNKSDNGEAAGEIELYVSAILLVLGLVGFLIHYCSRTNDIALLSEDGDSLDDMHYVAVVESKDDDDDDDDGDNVGSKDDYSEKELALIQTGDISSRAISPTKQPKQNNRRVFSRQQCDIIATAQRNELRRYRMSSNLKNVLSPEALEERKTNGIESKMTLNRERMEEAIHLEAKCEVLAWTMNVLGFDQAFVNDRMLSEVDANDAMDALRSGVLLCDLMERLTGKRIRNRHNEASTRGSQSGAVSSFFARENIASFLERAKALGVSSTVLFSPNDLLEAANEQLVVKCLCAVAKISAYKYKIQPPRCVALEMEKEGKPFSLESTSVISRFLGKLSFRPSKQGSKKTVDAVASLHADVDGDGIRDSNGAAEVKAGPLMWLSLLLTICARVYCLTVVCLAVFARLEQTDRVIMNSEIMPFNFVSVVGDFWNSGAIPLAIIIVLGAAVVPACKLFSLLLEWANVVQMEGSFRLWFDRWNLLLDAVHSVIFTDIFLMGYIMILFRQEVPVKGGTSNDDATLLELIADPQKGLYIGACSTLLMGILFQRTLVLQARKTETIRATCEGKRSMLFAFPGWCVSSVVSIFCTIAATGTLVLATIKPLISFTFGELVGQILGDNRTTVLDIPDIIIGIGRVPVGSTAPLGSLFVATICILLTTIVPLCIVLGTFLCWSVPMLDKTRLSVARALRYGVAWCGLPTLAVATLVGYLDMGLVAKFILVDNFGDICNGMKELSNGKLQCVRLDSELHGGFLWLCASCVFLLVSVLATELSAKRLVIIEANNKLSKKEGEQTFDEILLSAAV
eukprot:g1551.t1